MSFTQKGRSRFLLSAHIALIAVGAAVFTAFAFHKNIWFDEAYTIGLVSHGFSEILKIHTADVHPFLYYVLLKTFTLVFGSSLLSLRMFSVVGAVLFSSLGLTHIRRDHGEKVGFFFSFFAVFSASVLLYAEQIRMYSWAMLIVALAGIYAYRVGKKGGKQNSILFVLFSVCAAYTHYYALFAVAAINLVMLIRAVREKKKPGAWLARASVQIFAYIPGAAVFFKQAVSGGASWIKLSFPDNIFNTLAYPFLGELLSGVIGNRIAFFAVGIGLVVLFASACVLLFCRKRHLLKEDAFRWALEIFFGVIAFSLIVSLFRPIYYERYTVVLYGFLFFAFARAVSDMKKPTHIIAAVLVVCIFAVQTYRFSGKCFGETKERAETLFEEKIGGDDIVVSSSTDIYCFSVFRPNGKFYFYNKGKWNIKEAYAAFGENACVIESLDIPEIVGCEGSVFVINDGKTRDHLIAKGFSQTEKISFFSAYGNKTYEIARLDR